MLPPIPRALICLVIACGGLCWTGEAQAYAWMIKHGFSKCGSCHVDPSGGETLTGMGRMQSARLLSAGGDDVDELSDAGRFAFGLVGEPRGVSFGASYRHLAIYTAPVPRLPSTFTNFPMQVDAYGAARYGPFVFSASLGLAKGIEGTAHVRSAQLNRETGDGLILLSRNHYLGIWLQDQTLLRIGRLNLPYGVRIPEHVMWAREATRTDRESDQQHGASLSFSRGRSRTEVMLVLGNFQLNPDRFRERGVAGSYEYLLTPRLALGGSGLLTRAEEDRLTRVDDSIRYAFGANGRWGATKSLAILGEMNVLKEQARGRGYTGFLQADYEPIRGLHFMATGEVLDQGLVNQTGAVAIRGAGAARYGAWLSIDWFFATHFELRFDGLMRQDDVFHGIAQLHVYF